MDFSVIPRNLSYMLDGLVLTVILALSSMTASLITGTVFAMLRLASNPWVRIPTGIFIDVMRTIPLIMVIFWFFFLLPIVTGRPVTPISAVLIALVVFNTSYMAEVIRGGIISVPKTQMDAVRATGVGYIRAMWHVILPQAFRNMLPALISRFVALFMGTSLAYIIGVTEFFRAANNINNRVYQSYVIYGFVAIVYFVCCYALSFVGQRLQSRLDPVSRATTDRLIPQSSLSA